MYDSNNIDPDSVYQFVSDYLKENVIFGEEINWERFPLALKNTGKNAGLHLLDNKSHYYSESQFQSWASLLAFDQDIERSRIKPTSLFLCLKKAREEWQKQKTKTVSVEVKKGDKRMNSFADIEVEDVDIEIQNLNDDTTRGFLQCSFCRKEVEINDKNSNLLLKLCPKDHFYCHFCIRNDLHTKARLNTMIVSLRGLIGYMYNFCYWGRPPMLYISEIQDMVGMHIEIGLQNPVFKYDHETFCWFIDFSKIGNVRKKIPIKDVLKTINEMISCFNPYDYIKDFKSHKYAERFQEAIFDFYQKRYRPHGKPICSPTLVGCASDYKEYQKEYSTTSKKIDISEYRQFTPDLFIYHPRR